ncbi:NAD(P)H-dependent oxidoreductase [Micromonospora sp. WMMA1363]|uniref:flavodoxin family protein n=1 Tax=Micromonospora sp. WMMA1363 TaxID=3053985 RepID=UPI00259CE634|nr:NAD(P)H-dependent oxidoreductase [Micromonospora sp. WMMA1363]MDM4718762.1 NAD(P)H-dependent oxidoreductase [Micromonospora sp. WMMA1363]
MSTIRALVLNCTLKRSPAPSSSALLAQEVLDTLRTQGVDGELLRVVDHHVRFGVTVDEGDGDGWPAIRSKLLAAQILIIATPIWLGQPSAVCKMVLERLDAELDETDPQGRLLTYGRVAGVAVVGNEDGAHHTIGQVQQALNEVGFTCPAAAATYWVGEALHKVDYIDARPKPDTTGRTTKALALNCAHLARLLSEQPYPPPDTTGAARGPAHGPA